MRVTLYGASDDLIELEGDLSEEFYLRDDERPTYIGFSDGTLATISYTAGFWRIAVLRKGACKSELTQATDVEDDYSDRLTLTGTLTWVVAGESVRKRGK